MVARVELEGRVVPIKRVPHEPKAPVALSREQDAERLGAARPSSGGAKWRIDMTDEKNDIRAQVREYYGKTLGGSDDLKINACCCATERPPKYVLDVMPDIADEIVERF